MHDNEHLPPPSPIVRCKRLYQVHCCPAHKNRLYTTMNTQTLSTFPGIVVAYNMPPGTNFRDEFLETQGGVIAHL